MIKTHQSALNKKVLDHKKVNCFLSDAFKDKSSLSHLADCQFKDQLKKYECTVCGFIFKTPKKPADVHERKQGMERHIIARHMKIKKWRCFNANCKQTFSRHTEFKLHASSQHYNNKNMEEEPLNVHSVTRNSLELVI